MTHDKHRTVLIAGPTASGKSALALRLARERGGVVVNADSMQVYRELRILTARPTAEDEAAVPHALYGHVSAFEAYSVARWLEDVAGVLATAHRAGQTAIIVGGTGLFFKALLAGLSPIPPVPDDLRRALRDAAAQAEPGELHRMLAARDPRMADRLPPGDTQRIVRALEVMAATGRSLAEWQEMPGTPLVQPDDAERLLVWPERAVIAERCRVRFDAMMAEGALEEVAGLVRLGVPEERPVYGALGVRQLMATWTGGMSIAEATERAKVETLQYVKRQETWLRKHMRDWRHST